MKLFSAKLATGPKGNRYAVNVYQLSQPSRSVTPNLIAVNDSLSGLFGMKPKYLKEHAINWLFEKAVNSYDCSAVVKVPADMVGVKTRGKSTSSKVSVALMEFDTLLDYAKSFSSTYIRDGVEQYVKDVRSVAANGVKVAFLADVEYTVWQKTAKLPKLHIPADMKGTKIPPKAEKPVVAKPMADADGLPQNYINVVAKQQKKRVKVLQNEDLSTTSSLPPKPSKVDEPIPFVLTKTSTELELLKMALARIEGLLAETLNALIDSANNVDTQLLDFQRKFRAVKPAMPPVPEEVKAAVKKMKKA